jgi:hypothetical protein
MSFSIAHNAEVVNPENMFPDFISGFKNGSFQNYHYDLPYHYPLLQ